jgi:putative MATE family efflux protein
MKDLTQGKESRIIFRFAVPMLLGNVFQQMYNIVDSVIVGNYLGKEALGAVGASFPLIFLLVSLVIGIASGSTVVISQYFGARDLEKVKLAIDTLFIVMYGSSVVVTGVGFLFAGEIFQLIKLPAEILPQAVLFFKITMLGSITIFGYNATAAVLRGLGDSKTPLYFLIISTIVNAVLVFLFVVVFKWGIAGSAWATVIAQSGAFFSAVLYLNRYHKLIRINLIALKFDKEIFIKSLKIGLPSGFQSTFVALGMMALLRIVNDFGTDTVAAYSVAGRIDSFAGLPAMNFSMALSAFVGQNIGAGRHDRVKNGLISTIGMGLIISLVISIGVALFSTSLMSFFSPDPKVIEIGAQYLTIVASFYFAFSTMFALNGLFRGAGDTLIPMFITLFSLWVVRIPCAYFLSKEFGTIGVWWAIPIGWAMGLILSLVYYYSGHWKNKSVVKSPPHPVEPEPA